MGWVDFPWDLRIVRYNFCNCMWLGLKKSYLLKKKKKKKKLECLISLALHFIISEKAMAPYSSTLAWKNPWMEEPGRLQSMGLLRVRHDWATSLSLLLSCIGEGNGDPLQCSCLENPRDGEAWRASIYGVAQSWTRLKQLSSSSSSGYLFPTFPLSNMVLYCYKPILPQLLL